MSDFCRAIFVLLSLALSGLLCSCHRASYQFQVGGSLEQSEAVSPVIPAGKGAVLGVAGVAPQSRQNVRPTSFQKRPPHRLKSATAAAQAPVLTLLLKQDSRRAIKRLLQAISPPDPTPPAGQRSKAVAIVLAVLLGSLGAHLFYLGHRRRAIVYLLVTLAGVGLLASAIPIGAALGGSSAIGSVLVAATVLITGLSAILIVYFKALFDIPRIASDSL